MQSYDEDRAGFGTARAPVALEILGREGGDRFVNEVSCRNLIRGEFGRPQRIAGGIMGERLLVIAAVLKRLAQRKMDVERIRVRKPPAQRPTHVLEVARRETEGFEIGQGPIGFAKRRLDLECVAKSVDRFISPVDRL